VHHLDRFSRIFYKNCFKNGVLPIKVNPRPREADGRRRVARHATLTIDLPPEIRGPDAAWSQVRRRSFRKPLLLEGSTTFA